MPKMKTHRGAAKRFRKTATGKFRRQHAFARHLLTKKSRARKRALREETQVSAGDQRRLRRMLPHL